MPWQIDVRLLNPLVFDTDPLKIGRRSCLCHPRVRCYFKDQQKFMIDAVDSRSQRRHDSSRE